MSANRLAWVTEMMTDASAVRLLAEAVRERYRPPVGMSDQAVVAWFNDREETSSLAVVEVLCEAGLAKRVAVLESELALARVQLTHYEDDVVPDLESEIRALKDDLARERTE